MATTFSKNRQPSSSTDAHFRAWIEFIDNTLTNGGWVNTSDTGQTAVGSFVAPTTTHQARGYRVYRMDDALQSSAPIFMRLDFGSSNAAAAMGVWVSIGGSTDGAGVILDSMVVAATSGQANVQSSTSSTSLALPYSFGSADSNRVVVAFAVEVQAFGSGPYLFFSVERTFGTDGQPNADGILFMWAVANGSVGRYQYLQRAQGIQGGVDTAMFRVEALDTLSALSDRVGVSVLFAWFNGLPQQPGTNILLAKRGDWTRDARISVELYGVQRIYQALGSMTVASGGNTLALMRYE
jgi:hypothetical protein